MEARSQVGLHRERGVESEGTSDVASGLASVHLPQNLDGPTWVRREGLNEIWRKSPRYQEKLVEVAIQGSRNFLRSSSLGLSRPASTFNM